MSNEIHFAPGLLALHRLQLRTEAGGGVEQGCVRVGLGVRVSVWRVGEVGDFAARIAHFVEGDVE